MQSSQIAKRRALGTEEDLMAGWVASSPHLLFLGLAIVILMGVDLVFHTKPVENVFPAVALLVAEGK